VTLAGSTNPLVAGSLARFSDGMVSLYTNRPVGIGAASLVPCIIFRTVLFSPSAPRRRSNINVRDGNVVVVTIWVLKSMADTAQEVCKVMLRRRASVTRRERRSARWRT
jgi:hypothetical protein